MWPPVLLSFLGVLGEFVVLGVEGSVGQPFVLVIEGPPGHLVAMWLPVQLFILLGAVGGADI